MQAYRDQRSVDDPVVGATWIDGDAQRVQHIEGVVLGKHIASKKQRGRRCVVGEKAVWSRKHGAVVEVQIPLLRLLNRQPTTTLRRGLERRSGSPRATCRTRFSTASAGRETHRRRSRTALLLRRSQTR